MEPRDDEADRRALAACLAGDREAFVRAFGPFLAAVVRSTLAARGVPDAPALVDGLCCCRTEPRIGSLRVSGWAEGTE